MHAQYLQCSAFIPAAFARRGVAATFGISVRCLIHCQCLQRLKNQGIYRLFKLNFLYVTRETIIKKSIYKAIAFRQMLLFYIIWLSADNEYLWVYNDLRYVDNDVISLNSDWRAVPVGLRVLSAFGNKQLSWVIGFSAMNSFREQLIFVCKLLAVAIDCGGDLLSALNDFKLRLAFDSERLLC